MLASLHCIVTTQDKDQVAWFCTECFLHLLKYFLSIELVYAGFYIAVSFNAGIYHTFRTNLRTLYIICQLVELFACISSSTFSTDTTDVSSAVKYREAMSFHDVHQFNELHAEADIRLVATVVFHGICPRHTNERFSKFHTAYFLE